MRKLTKCRICTRPMLLYGMKPKDQRKLGTVREMMFEAQGPKVFPKIKRWCHGHCDGIIIEVGILVDELLSGKSKKMKEWARDLLHDIETKYFKLIKDLAAGKDSC